jgi:hypothetical protein
MKNQAISENFFFRHDDTVLKIVNIVIAAALVLDIALGVLSDVITKLSPTIAYEIVFVIFISIFTAGQLLILELIRRKNKEIIAKTPFLNTLDKIVRVFQYGLNLILILIAVQIGLFSSYSTSLLLIGSTIAYAIAMLTVAVLSLLFFRWYMRNKTFSIFMYGSASCSVVVAILLIATLTDYVLPLAPPERNADSQVNLFVFESNPIGGSIQYLAATYSAVSFLLFWVSTLVLLSHYAKRMGYIRFWPLMSVPVISFVIQYAVVVPIMASLAGSPDVDVVYVTIFGNVLPVVTGGLLYGIPFWITSRALKDGNNVMIRKYLVIAAWGAVFLQLTSSGAAYTAPYPPFGFVTLLFTPVACYLVLFGIYSSAISIAGDSKLRQSIRKYTIEESSKLVRDIGSANMKQTLEKKVLEIAKNAGDSMAEQSGIHPSITDEDVQDYLKDVLSEIKDRKDV